MKIYGISGLGADRRVFNYLSLNYDFIPLDWIAPLKKESISEYSIRLSKCIDQTDEYIILGVSFGGLVATEISKVLSPSMTILISSAETKSELPILFRLLGRTGLLKILPTKIFNPPKKLAHYLFGTKRKKLLNDILNDTDLKFTKWAVNQLVIWDNNQTLKRVLKINGTDDKLIPPKRNRAMELINKGEHFMIVDRAKEISIIINEKISNLVINNNN